MWRLNQIRLLLAAGVLMVLTFQAKADMIPHSVFATGVSSTSPDSVTYGDGSVWIAYQNGAASTGGSGSSTVVRYSPSGSVLRTSPAT